MSESQSRYSIVERLTNSKLELLSNKSNVDNGIYKLEEDLRNKRVELSAYAIEADENKDRGLKHLDKQITNIENDIEYNKSAKDRYITTIDLKITEIDKALKSIEDISKSAPTPAEQA